MNKMSEDEKKAIDMLEKYITEHKLYNIKQSDGLEDNIKMLLDLYKQEKEKNKELEEKLKVAKQLYNDSCIRIATECVEKDKIRAKIKELEEKSDYWNCDEIEVLKELLEEE